MSKCSRMSYVFRIVFVAAVCAASLLPIQASASAELWPVVQKMLVQAPGNFSIARGATGSSDVYYTRYAIAPALKSTCAKCEITDEYAWTAHSENWYLEDPWHVARTWSKTKVASYVTAQLSPHLSGYTLHKTGSKDYPTYTWSSAKNVWVYVSTFNGGFTLRVGHDLAKPAHVLRAPSADQLAALSSGVGIFVGSGIGPASDNFASLRTGGKKDFLGDMTYGVNISFGSMLRSCEITDGSANTMALSDYSPKWSLRCETVPMVGTVAGLEGQVQSAMRDALPVGFTVTTGSILFTDDYRWDDSETQVMADIDSFGTYLLPKGLVQFDIGIVHFLPKT